MAVECLAPSSSSVNVTGEFRSIDMSNRVLVNEEVIIQVEMRGPGTSLEPILYCQARCLHRAERTFVDSDYPRTRLMVIVR
jgi:hypothetical protein